MEQKTNVKTTEHSTRTKSITFTKFHVNIPVIFDGAESVFIMQMVSAEYRAQLVRRPYWSKSFVMDRMGMKERVFNRCVARFKALNLVESETIGLKVLYKWNIPLYERLLDIITATENIYKLRKFWEAFVEQGRSIESVTDDEIVSLSHK